MSLCVLARGVSEPSCNPGQACTHGPTHMYAHPRKHESVFPHMWLHLVMFTYHTCLYMYKHVCVYSLHVRVDTSNPAGASYSSHLPTPRSDDGDGEREGREREAPTPPPQHQQTCTVRLLVFARHPGHCRVCLFSLSDIDLLVNLLNITSGKKSTQQLSLIQEKD